MTNEELIDKYRLDAECILDVLETIGPDLERRTARTHAIPAIVQLTTALRFFATGSFQRECGDIHGLSKPSVSRCIDAVSRAISQRVRNYITFPTTDEELRVIKKGFFEINGFPNVIGAINGTLIAIKGPSADEPLYVCRKGFHAINVQVVCDAQLRILNIVAKWPGSTHDSYIFSTSELSVLLETMPDSGWLLGDSGYGLKPFLLTPVFNPNSRGEQRYNDSHAKTRVVIERFNGVWKSRFRCLDKSGGALQYKPNKSVNIIVATACLHQLCVKHNLPLPIEDDVRGDRVANDATDNGYRGEQGVDGRRVGNRLIVKKFSN